jgi:hypothetical protein
MKHIFNKKGTNGFSQRAQGLNRKERKTTDFAFNAFVFAGLRSLRGLCFCR